MLSDDFIIESIPDNADFDDRTKMLWFGRFIESAVLAKAAKQVHGDLDATGRSAQDYAIEHAEYMATSAEQLLNHLNKCTNIDDCVIEPDENFSDYTSGLRLSIHDFRKRRDRAKALPAPKQEPIYQYSNMHNVSLWTDCNKEAYEIMRPEFRRTVYLHPAPTQSAAIPEGYVLMPKIPTSEILREAASQARRALSAESALREAREQKPVDLNRFTTGYDQSEKMHFAEFRLKYAKPGDCPDKFYAAPVPAMTVQDYIAAALELAVKLYSHKWNDELAEVNTEIMKKGMGFIHPEGIIEFARQIKSGEFDLNESQSEVKQFHDVPADFISPTVPSSRRYGVSKAAAPKPEGEIENPHEWIIEKLSYHKYERDDLTIDDCLKYLATEWTEVSGRTTRQMVMQILALLAQQEQPQSAAANSEGGL